MLSRKRCVLLGPLGEHYVMFKLLQKGLQCIKPDPMMADYDIYVENRARIEVKTSQLKKQYHKKFKTTQECWHFSNHKTRGVKKVVTTIDRNCDFFIFVCLDEKFNVAKTFIVPKEIIKTRRSISVPREFKRKVQFSLKDYENKWKLITKFPKKLEEAKSRPKRRITIPKHLIKRLGWNNGDEIEFHVDRDDIIMRKVRT